MKFKLNDNRIEKIITFVCGCCVVSVILLLMNLDYPFVGHDYRYFIPRLLDTDLHIRLNGLSVQWYTPSFGGGLPAYPNPQHLEYSLVQGLSFFINPWFAILLTTGIVSFIGYYYFFKFLTEILAVGWMPGTLGAMFFLGNGFYIEHMIAGHLGFQLFPLAAVILYLLLEMHNKYLYNAIAIALLIAMILYQGGFFIAVVIGMSFGITLPMLYLCQSEIFDLKRISRVVVWAILLSACIAGSKIYATLSFMRYFPREISDNYNVGLPQALIGMVAQLFGVMTLMPVFLITHTHSEFLSGSLSNITGAKYGIWEIDTGLSPVLLIILLVGLAILISKIRRIHTLKFRRSQILTFIILLVAVWGTIELILARGMIYMLLKQLPIIRSLHVNVRFTAAFIIPLTIVGVFLVNRFFLEDIRRPYFYAAAVLTLMSLLSYFVISRDVYSLVFNMNIANATYEQMMGGETFPVQRIMDVQDVDGFMEHASSYKPYEALFGYELQTLASEVHPGEIFEASGGYFNMTNPASLVYPDINHLRPFERIKIDEQDKLEAFAQRRQPDWNIPAMQIFLNWLALIGLISSIIVLLFIIPKKVH